MKLSYNDRKITLLGQFLAQVGPITSSDVAQSYLTAIEEVIDKAVITLESQDAAVATTVNLTPSLHSEQLAFSFTD